MTSSRDEGSGMAQGTTWGRIGLSLLSAAVLMVFAVPSASAADPGPCRVRNVTQDTSGRSLARMVERADDGDRLRVRGTCPGEIAIDVDVVIEGAGDDPTLTGRGRTLVVRVRRGTQATVRGLTIQRGQHRYVGGILNRGRLTLEEVLVRRNSRGGIWNDRRMVIVSSVVRSNAGGGILNTHRLEVVDSIIRRNSSRSSGGGILNSYGSHVTLTDSTISDNYSGCCGGGIYNGDSASGSGGETVTLMGTTVTGNVARFGGGGIGTSDDCGGNVTLDASSSVTGNSPDDFPAAEAC